VLEKFCLGKWGLSAEMQNLLAALSAAPVALDKAGQTRRKMLSHRHRPAAMGEAAMSAVLPAVGANGAAHAARFVDVLLIATWPAVLSARPQRSRHGCQRVLAAITHHG